MCEPASIDSTVPVSPPAASKKLLVVDDEEYSRRALERVLGSFGHEVEVAKDGLEGTSSCNSA